MDRQRQSQEEALSSQQETGGSSSLSAPSGRRGLQDPETDSPMPPMNLLDVRKMIRDADISIPVIARSW